jgi:hypothetical protein
MSAFMIFTNANRKRLKEENEDATFGDLGKLAGEEWRGLSNTDKKKYEEMNAEDKKRYAKEMKSYVPGENTGGKRKANVPRIKSNLAKKKTYIQVHAQTREGKVCYLPGTKQEGKLSVEVLMAGGRTIKFEQPAGATVYDVKLQVDRVVVAGLRYQEIERKKSREVSRFCIICLPSLEGIRRFFFVRELWHHAPART